MRLTGERDSGNADQQALKHRARRFAPDALINVLTGPAARAVGERLPKWFLNRVWGDWLFPRLAAISRADGITGSGAV